MIINDANLQNYGMVKYNIIYNGDFATWKKVA